MKLKKVCILVIGILLSQFVLPSFDASEVKSEVVEESEVKYAPLHPTPEEVAAADPTDIVRFEDEALNEYIMSISGGQPVTVGTLQRVASLHIPINSGVKDLTGLEYGVSMFAIMFDNNEVSDLTPLANLKQLETIYARNNKISDLTPLADLPKLRTLIFSNNQISDFSPLSNQYNAGAIFPAAIFNNQVINLPDKIVTSNDEILFDIIGFNGTKYPVSLGNPEKGENNLTGNIEIPVDTMNGYSATVNQKVIYRTVNGDASANTFEGTVLSDNELIELFNVVNDVDKVVSVDQSRVNYDVPGTYEVVFATDEDSITSELIINDILPTITLNADTFTTQVGSKNIDLIAGFGVEATEITKGDLTNVVTIDDSTVDYNQTGTYEILFSVIDDEGHNVETKGSLKLVDEEIKSEVTSEETKSEAMSEETTSEETESEIQTGANSSATESVSEVTVVAVESEKVEETKTAVSSNAVIKEISTATNNKVTLKSTGSNITLLFWCSGLIGIILITYKKIMIVNNN